MARIRTGRLNVICDNSGAGLWNPMTDAMDTTQIKKFKMNFWFSGKPSLLTIPAQPAAQFSDDGFGWDTTTYPLRSVGSYFDVISAGWKYTGHVQDLFALTSPKLFVRFGSTFRNATSAHHAAFLSELELEIGRVLSRTYQWGPDLVFTDGTSTDLFSPLSDWMPSGDFNGVDFRATLALAALAGAISVKPAFQSCDKPLVKSDWSAFTSFGTARNAYGTGFGTTFASLSGTDFTKDYVRFGVVAHNESSETSVNGCRVQLRLDIRK